jgi:cation-transporting ATPase 13A1
MQVLLYLFTIWSVDVRCLVRFRRVRRLEDATIVKVVPHAFTGTRDIVPLERRCVVGFSFQVLFFTIKVLVIKKGVGPPKGSTLTVCFVIN